jgi:hypothetical protein
MTDDHGPERMRRDAHDEEVRDELRKVDDPDDPGDGDESGELARV